ncbi:MAG TPA: sulfatase-like hydrolase/transferase [Casimicrobiaceae bacterium]|nr:sulfatase-like hydrolase/transferase [Casimicrobiaceae bacterium]
MKNLLILHLESITRQRLAAFAPAFPNTRRLMRDSLVFDNFFSSATSTLMVVGYLLHGNDFEFDASSEFEGMRPAANNRNLFSVLRSRGYNAQIVCLNGFHATRPTRLAAWPDDLPPVWGSNDFPTLFARFDELTDVPPFAIYVWDLVTHIEHSLALAPFSAGLTDQIRRACSIADDAIGTMLATLERKGLLDDTTIVVYGDHGDDYWTHGFKGGMVHATEPYTQITWTPLAIRDPGLAPGTSEVLASTIDIAPTCRALLGIDDPDVFPYSGANLLTGAAKLVFSQNFTANQPDNRELDIAQAYAVTDDACNLVASSRGLELYAYRLDPDNHCNLLHFFDLLPDGSIALRARIPGAAHFRAALQDNPRAAADLASRFAVLRAALARRVAAKRTYIAEHGNQPVYALDPRSLNTVDERDRAAFFRHADGIRPAAAMQPFAFSFKLG